MSISLQNAVCHSESRQRRGEESRFLGLRCFATLNMTALVHLLSIQTERTLCIRFFLE